MPSASPTISIERWGRDYWSVFAYIESLCVNGIRGYDKPDRRRVQTKADRHPGLMIYGPNAPGDGSGYPIRLGRRHGVARP